MDPLALHRMGNAVRWIIACQSAMGSLRDVVAKRNIRSIVVQLASASAATAFAQIESLQVTVLGLLALLCVSLSKTDIRQCPV